MWVLLPHSDYTYADIFRQLVEADGIACQAEPATNLPLTQAYYVF